MIDRYKIHRIVEHIRQYAFEFDVIDVEEELSDILSYYGFGDVILNSEEEALLIAELTPFAEQFEFREVEVMAFHEELIVA